MQKNRISIRVIATFMVFMVSFVAMPLQAIALGLENTELIDSNVNDNTIDETVIDSEQEVFIVEENISKRGQFEKHYLCSDGTYISVTYPEAIHYLDNNNQWQDVDQTLTYDSASDMYISDQADFEVSFSNKASADNMARIKQNGYTLSWSIQMTKKSGNAQSISVEPSNSSINSNTDVVLMPSASIHAIIENPVNNEKTDINDRLVANSNTFSLPKTSSQINYTNIFDETQIVSLKYTVYHNKIEEDIIISERGELQSVSMNMDIGLLTPIVNADGSVDLVDANNEMQFHIGIPYMVDAKHSVCNDIQVTAVKNGTSCIITYTPNAEWFESSERVFPILLDPSITTNDYVSNIEDTYVEQNATTNHSSEQYLYFNPNSSNGNRRNIIVRVAKLPEIDASMPIISATLSLAAQNAPLSNVSLKAGYIDTVLELSEYDYDLTTDDYYSYIAYSYLNTGSNRVTFDFSSHIYEMYGDLEFDEENGYDYHGDFVIGYSDENDTTFAYPFYSSEYTMPANRPVFTVKYGYTLPAGILDNNIYSFQNRASFSYMTVNGAEPSNNSNIYQTSNDENIATTNQKFKLEYVPTSGGYLLRSMSSSSGNDKVVDIQRAGGEIYSGRNVQIYSAIDPISQEWLIVPVDYNVFRIVPRSNMSLTLTAGGYEDGSNTGTTSTSAGNIFVQTFSVGDNFQEWYIYDNENNEISTDEFRAVTETGNYFLGNFYTGKYLHRNGNLVNGMSGMLSSLGEETVKWQIVNLGDGYCTIQRSDTPHYYLAPTGTTSESGIRVYSNISETIPENYKWSIRIASGGGCIIQHKTSGLYLSGISSTSNPSSVCLYALNSPGTDAYNKQVWRVANEDYYVELGYGVSFNDIAIDINKVKTASINKSPGSASWSSYSDFDYTITSGGNYVTYDVSSHKFVGTAPGTATVTATHKTTHISRSFDIKVNNNAIIIVPGIMGTELVAGPNNSSYSQGTKLWSYSLLNSGLSYLEIADRIISLRCDDNGNSLNDVVPYNNTYGAGEVYKPLFNNLNDEYGGEYTVEFFAYDWRLSNAISATALNTFINNKGYDKVILVCHSMGGLVASGYLPLGETQRSKVETVIMLGSPLLGTSVIPYLWGSEDFEVTGLLDTIGLEDWHKTLLEYVTLYYDIFDMFISNFRSMYELFPSEKYFDSAYAGKNYLVTSILGASDLEITTYSETKERLSSYLPYYESNHINSAETFHSSLYSNSNHMTELVNTYYVAGVNVSTVDKIECNMWDWNVYSNTSLGDSLVATWSATLGDRSANRTFYANNVGHMGLISNLEIHQFVVQLIYGNTSLNTYNDISANIP